MPKPSSYAQASAICARGGRFTELRAAGTVVSLLGERESRSGLHEGFFVRFGNAAPVRVEDNADITGIVPLRAGEHILIQGQYECDDDVLHWTHHDPSGRHLAGFIEADGHTYR